MNKSKKTALRTFVLGVIVLLAINALSNVFFKRFDLTADKRFTLSETTISILDSVDSPITFEIYLEGNLQPSFKKLQTETRQLLEEYQALNTHIKFNFVNPLEGNEKAQLSKAEELYVQGIRPLNVTVTDKGKQSQEMVFPWAKAIHNQKEVIVPLIKNTMGYTTEEMVNVSVQHLEYAITDAIKKAITEKSKKIAIIKGIGEPADIEIADLLLGLRESYFIAPFVLDSVANNPKGTLQQLNEFDVALINKPSKPFTDEQIQVLDQYIINGGKALFFIDEVQADMDSLQRNGQMLAYPKDLSLGPMLFKYGVRVNPVLVKDEIGIPIKIAVGSRGSQTQYEEFVWKFSPYAFPISTHPIVKNIEGVKFEFANSIDTLKNGVKKTVLLQSSPYSRTIGAPSLISLDILGEQSTPEEYEGKGNIPLAVLLEGDFTSVYNNRVLPFEDKSFKNVGKGNKIIVVADGDVVRNQLDQNYQPLELGYDKWTNKLYGNKEFVLNSINYLVDDSGLLNLRSKEIKLALLDKERVFQDYSKIQLLLVVLPVVVILLFGVIFTYFRKKKYTK